jgi:hypothetical protein
MKVLYPILLASQLAKQMTVKLLLLYQVVLLYIAIQKKSIFTQVIVYALVQMV